MTHRQMAISELFHTSSCSMTRSASSFSIPLGQFGCLTFHRGVIEKMLPKEIVKNVLLAMKGKEKLNPLYCNAIADAMKDWAVNLGATHYCHWFQPLTGSTAEKQDAFLDIGSKGEIIEKFSGKLLLRGEPDASSFPSGGLRETSKARGYTCWDAQSPPFIWKTDGKATLCIPAVFFSWSQEALDLKIPLMRSEEKLCQAFLRLLRFLGSVATHVHSTLGCEQEYFVVARNLLGLRPDLMLTGRTLFGAPSCKGQEFEDHYFASIPEKILHFMRDVEEKAFHLGIPLKTRHCEVAPHQYEVAPLFEKSLQAIDHNILLMQMMHQKAQKHGLACLFHEKPFKGLNGSGKHCNWSLMTDTGMNLLDPSLAQENPLLFLSSITAVISAVYEHASLLRASIASPGNDHRLGGHEAPPALISIYLGEELERFLGAVENQLEYSYQAEHMVDVNIPSLPDLLLDLMDRNRTAPFAFTGNKFEFRSVGSHAHPAEPMTVLNAVVATSLNQMVDEMERLKAKGESLEQSVLSVVRQKLMHSKSVRYLGNNYSDDWKEEASKRGLPSIEKSLHSFFIFREKEVDSVFAGVLSKEEREARVFILEENYVKTLKLEAALMVELFDTQIFPASLEYQTFLAQNLQLLEGSLGAFSGGTKEVLFHLSGKMREAFEIASALKKEIKEVLCLPAKAQAFAFCDRIALKMNALRSVTDELEMIVQDKLWPLPKYRELLFSL